MGKQTGNSGDLMMQMKKSESLKVAYWRTHLLWKADLFVLLKLPFNWMRPTHIMEGNLLYPKCPNLNVNLIPEHPPGLLIKLTVTWSRNIPELMYCKYKNNCIFDMFML